MHCLDWTALVVLTESSIELHRLPSPGRETPPFSPVAAFVGELGGASEVAAAAPPDAKCEPEPEPEALADRDILSERRA
jgi:hypothetical protein